MLSLRSAYSRFILSGAICCAIVLGLPTESLAESVNLINDYYAVPCGFVNKATVTASDLSIGNLSTSYRQVSSFVYYRFDPKVSSSVSNPNFYMRFSCDSLGITDTIVKVVAPSSFNNCTVSSVRYFVSVGSTKTEIYPTDGDITLPDDAEYLFVVCKVSGTPLSADDFSIYRSQVQIWTSVPDEGLQQVVQNQTDQLKDTTGSDTVTSDVTSQYTQQVEGLQLFQFVENLDETFANTLTTQETDSTVRFPGMNLAGFQIPAANVDPLQLVPADLVTPIKMIVTFTFCAAFIEHIISLLHAIFEIYDYANGVWVDAATEGDRVTSAVTLSGWE